MESPLNLYDKKEISFLYSCATPKDLFIEEVKHLKPKYRELQGHKKLPKLVVKNGKVVKISGRTKDVETLNKNKIKNKETQTKEHYYSAVNRFMCYVIRNVNANKIEFSQKSGNYVYRIFNRFNRIKNSYHHYFNKMIFRVEKYDRKGNLLKVMEHTVTGDLSSRTKDIFKDGPIKPAVKVINITDVLEITNAKYKDDIPNFVLRNTILRCFGYLRRGLKKGVNFRFYEFNIRRKNENTSSEILNCLNNFVFLSRSSIPMYKATYKDINRKVILKYRFLRTIKNIPYQGYYFGAVSDLELKYLKHKPLELMLFYVLEEAQLYKYNSPNIIRVRVDLNPDITNYKKYTIIKNIKYEEGITEHLQRWDGERFKPVNYS